MSGCRGGFSNKERGGRSRGASYSGGGIGNVGSGWGSDAVASSTARPQWWCTKKNGDDYKYGV